MYKIPPEVIQRDEEEGHDMGNWIIFSPETVEGVCDDWYSRPRPVDQIIARTREAIIQLIEDKVPFVVHDESKPGYYGSITRLVDFISRSFAIHFYKGDTSRFSEFGGLAFQLELLSYCGIVRERMGKAFPQMYAYMINNNHM